MDNKKILIIDDETDFIVTTEKILYDAGYIVLSAPGAEEGIRMAKEKRPDLILLDILMPGMSGVEAAEVLKNDVYTKNIPIIFLTCLYSKEEEALKGHIIKDNVFLPKPCEKEEMLNEIKKQLKA